MSKESGDHPFVPAHDRRVQRGEAGRSHVRIGAALEEEFDQLGMTGVSCHGRGAHAPGIRIVHAAARSHEELRRGDITRARRKHQRGVPSVRDRAVVVEMTVRRHRHHLIPDVRASMNVRAVREQNLDHIGMFLRRRPHQRRLPPRRVRVHVGALRDQLFDDDGAS